MYMRSRSFQLDDNKFIVDNHSGEIVVHILFEATSAGTYLSEFALTPERAMLLAAHLMKFATEQEEIDNY